MCIHYIVQQKEMYLNIHIYNKNIRIASIKYENLTFFLKVYYPNYTTFKRKFLLKEPAFMRKIFFVFIT